MLDRICSTSTPPFQHSGSIRPVCERVCHCSQCYCRAFFPRLFVMAHAWYDSTYACSFNSYSPFHRRIMQNTVTSKRVVGRHKRRERERTIAQKAPPASFLSGPPADCKSGSVSTRVFGQRTRRNAERATRLPLLSNYRAY
jgi:hypothetical protein